MRRSKAITLSISIALALRVQLTQQSGDGPTTRCSEPSLRSVRSRAASSLSASSCCEFMLQVRSGRRACRWADSPFAKVKIVWLSELSHGALSERPALASYPIPRPPVSSSLHLSFTVRTNRPNKLTGANRSYAFPFLGPCFLHPLHVLLVHHIVHRSSRSVRSFGDFP